MRQREARATTKVEFVRALIARKIRAIRAPNAAWVDRPLLAAASCAGFVERDGAPGARLFVRRKRAAND